MESDPSAIEITKHVVILFTHKRIKKGLKQHSNCSVFTHSTSYLSDTILRLHCSQ